MKYFKSILGALIATIGSLSVSSFLVNIYISLKFITHSGVSLNRLERDIAGAAVLAEAGENFFSFGTSFITMLISLLPVLLLLFLGYKLIKPVYLNGVTLYVLLFFLLLGGIPSEMVYTIGLGTWSFVTKVFILLAVVWIWRVKSKRAQEQIAID